MHYRSILVVTYGRSGSTLLQGILNSIDGVVIRGENNDFCFGLYQAWRSLVLTQKHCKGSDSPRNSWYGASDLKPELFIAQVRNLIRDQLLPKDQVDICYGFKEIRYLKRLDELTSYLDFLSIVFPEPAFIFNIRNHADVYQSGFWKNYDKNLILKNLGMADNLFSEYVHTHDNALLVNYEAITSGLDEIKSLLRFLGAPFDEELLRAVLKTPHGYEQKPHTLEKARTRGGL